MYDPLFPSGAELEVQQSFADFSDAAASRNCVIKVDGDEAIQAQAGGHDYQDFIGFYKLEVDMGDAKRVSGDFEALVWPHAAMASTPCHVPSAGGNYFIRQLTLALVADSPSDEEESVQVLSEVIQPFMAQTMAMTPCLENQERE